MKIAALLVLAAGSVANAQTWAEVPDAGNLVGSAQGTGVGGLNIITGNFSAGSDVDMFAIRVTDWSAFSATVGNLSNNLDSQLFLFDGLGNGIAFNDDASGLLSALPVGNAIYSGRTNGEVVYIAISQYNFDPQNATPAFMFPNSFSGVFAPIAAGPVTSWVGGGGAALAYEIRFTGVEAVPTPGAAALLGLGGLVGLRRRR